MPSDRTTKSAPPPRGASSRSGRRSLALRVSLASLALALAAVLAIAVRYESAARRQLSFERVRVTAAMRAEAVRALGPLDDVELHTRDGLLLRGWFAASHNRAAVILVHGGAANRTQLLPEATALERAGFGVLLYDSRASGESDGELTTWGDRERSDLAAAVDFVAARKDVDADKIGAQGLSIGGSTVALGAAADPRIHAVLLNATWTTLDDEIAHKYGKYGLLSITAAKLAFRRSGIDVDAVRPIDGIDRIAPRPLFIATGSADDDTPPIALERLLARAGAPKELWIVEGAGHGGYAEVSPEAYPKRVVAFFESSLTKPR